MIVDGIVAWSISIGIAIFLYGSFLSTLFLFLRYKRHLYERFSAYGNGITKKWEKTSNKLDDKRLRSLQVESKLKAFLSHPVPSFKAIEYMFYRSGVFENSRMHIICQAVGVVVTTDAFFLFYGTTLSTSFFLGLFASLSIHLYILQLKEKSWKKAFINTFPVSLDIINRGLKSGMTLGRGIAMVSEEVEDPVGGEFNYIASQLQIGISPDDALTEAAARIGIDEFRFFSLALIIQREMGGSLAEVLGKLADVIRERDRFRKKVWTLSSEGRATALIVGSLPIFLAIMVELISPGYIKFFFIDPRGKIMLWICGALTLTGAVVITRMMKVEA